jgi:uncharacterized phage protein gp47/JayE
MNPIELEITYLDGTTVTVSTIAADLVAFETKFNIAVSRLQDDPRVTYMFFLAWHALHRSGGTKEDFDKWVNTVSGVGQAEVKK